MDHGTDITTAIKNFVAQSTLNDMGLEVREKIFDTPLVGFSSCTDSLYNEYKSPIGSFYFTPLELFEKSFADKKVTAEGLTVISWIIPSTAATRN